MKKIANKFFRDNMDNMITNKFRRLYPHFEFEHQFRRLPAHPKIVLYSSVPTIDKFIEQILPNFQVINPKISNETDEDLTRSIAKDIIFPQAHQNDAGVVLKGFPFNTTQALLLDRYLSGVNLVLHVKTNQPSGDLGSLLQYYDERGALVEIQYKDEFDAQQLQNLQFKVRSSMKSSYLN